MVVSLLIFTLGLAFLLKVCYNKWKDSEVKNKIEDCETTSRQYKDIVNFKKENENIKKKQETVNQFLKGE